MKAAPFAYQRVGSLADAVRAFGNAAAGAKVMGGGSVTPGTQSLRAMREAYLGDEHALGAAR